MHAEIRGRGRQWKVWTPDQSQMAHTIPVYDEFGDFKEMVLVGAPPSEAGIKYVECYGGPFATQEEAIEYARYLGYDEVKITTTKTKTESLAMARKARKEGSDAAEDA